MSTAAIGLIPGFTGPISRAIVNPGVTGELASLASNSVRALPGVGLDLGNPFKVPAIQALASA